VEVFEEKGPAFFSSATELSRFSAPRKNRPW